MWIFIFLFQMCNNFYSHCLVRLTFFLTILLYFVRRISFTIDDFNHTFVWKKKKLKKKDIILFAFKSEMSDWKGMWQWQNAIDIPSIFWRVGTFVSSLSKIVWFVCNYVLYCYIYLFFHCFFIIDRNTLIF